jgi:hypothetical protein
MSAIEAAPTQLEAAQSKPPRRGELEARVRPGCGVAPERLRRRWTARSNPSSAQPDAWLDAIRRVLASGDEPQARRELQRVPPRYPGFRVPDDLAQLVE